LTNSDIQPPAEGGSKETTRELTKEKNLTQQGSARSFRGKKTYVWKTGKLKGLVGEGDGEGGRRQLWSRFEPR